MAQQTIEFNQGDDYLLRLNNFNPEHKYKVYIQFFDEDGAFVGNQLSYDVNYTDSVDVLLPAAFTDNLTVPLGEDYQLYYLGGKQAEVVINKVNLYAYDNDGSSLYTHNLNPKIDDVLYDADNEETENIVSQIYKIETERGIYTRNNHYDIGETATLYAWYYGGGGESRHTIWTLSANPSVGDDIYNAYNFSVIDTVSAVDTINNSIQRNNQASTEFSYTRDSSKDETYIETVTAFGWHNSQTYEHTHTLSASPTIGDVTYDDELIAEDNSVTGIEAFYVNSDLYERNANNDTEKIISTAYTGEKTIISELANKRPVIVYKKRAEGPV